MVDEIVDLVVSVDQGRSVSWLRLGVSEEGDHVVEVGYFPDCFLGLDVDSLTLGFGDSAQCFKLSIVESDCPPEAF